MTDTKPNTALAYAVLDDIDADPDSWDQDEWYRETHCGTVACFGGRAILLAGGEIDRETEEIWFIKVAGGDYCSYYDAACAALGIEDDDVPGYVLAELFAGDNDRVNLGLFVEAIFGPRPAVTA